MIKRLKESILTAWYEIQNFIYVRRIINKSRGSAKWKEFGFRVDWVCRVYTVINPRKEDSGETEESIRLRVADRILPMHRYMDSLGLSESIAISCERIGESDSYLLVYYPIFNVVTTWRVFWAAIIIAAFFLFNLHMLVWKILVLFWGLLVKAYSYTNQVS